MGYVVSSVLDISVGDRLFVEEKLKRVFTRHSAGGVLAIWLEGHRSMV